MSDPYKRHQRKGRWKVSRDMLLDYRSHAFCMAMQQDVLIVGTNYEIMTNVVEFHGISEHFCVVPEGEIVPLYEPLAFEHYTGPSAIPAIAVRWERVDEN